MIPHLIRKTMSMPKLQLLTLSALAAGSALATVSAGHGPRDAAEDGDSFIKQCGQHLEDRHLDYDSSTHKWYLHAVCEGAEDGTAHCSELDLDKYVSNAPSPRIALSSSRSAHDQLHMSPKHFLISASCPPFLLSECALSNCIALAGRRFHLHMIFFSLFLEPDKWSR